LDLARVAEHVRAVPAGTAPPHRLVIASPLAHDETTRKEDVMSAQSGTIAPRRTIEPPIWAVGLVALLLLAALAVTIGTDRSSGPTRVGGVRTQTFPGALETSGFVRPVPAVTFPGGLETSGIVRPAPAVTFPGALETAGVARPAPKSAGGQPILIGDYE